MKRVFKRVASFAPAKKNAGYRMSSLRSFKQFKRDKQVFKEIDTCSFIRPYIVGETDGFDLSEDIDLNKIKWTYVLSPGDLEHIKSHMAPLPTHIGTIVFDTVEEERVHARVLLTQEQMELIRDSAKKQAHRQ